MNLHWFASKNVRIAGDMIKHVKKILDAQRDLLEPSAVDAVEIALNELKDVAASGNDEAIRQQMANLETVATKWLKPYPHAGIRENVEVLLVALAVAMAIRTFFVQPFKIPTGSMQPTLFGVTSENLKEQPQVKIPGTLERIWDGAICGLYYHYLVAEEDGEIVSISPPEHVFKFINKIEMTVRYASGNKSYSFWMTPDDTFSQRAGIGEGITFHKGDEIVKFREIAGDHLFVDRVSYNFRHPKRGEIIVFETRGIGNEYAHLPPDQFYIKRMVAMGGEKVSLGNDRHLVIDGVRLDKTTPHFENVYSFDPTKAPSDCSSPNNIHYSGHINGEVANQVPELQRFRIAPLFPDQSTVYQIPPEHYMVMGDNTANSFDSRAWGDFSRTNVIGKYFFVYWPISPRFGWSVK